MRRSQRCNQRVRDDDYAGCVDTVNSHPVRRPGARGKAEGTEEILTTKLNCTPPLDGITVGETESITGNGWPLAEPVASAMIRAPATEASRFIAARSCQSTSERTAAVSRDAISKRRAHFDVARGCALARRRSEAAHSNCDEKKAVSDDP
jgi:hypothetical protein